MIFLMGLIYCLWLRMFAPQWGRRKVIAGLNLRVRGLVLGAMIAGLLMTQSRGPWAGMVLALLLGVLVWKLPAGRAALVFLALVAVLSVAAYSWGKRYTDTDINQAVTEEQRNAIYRRQLVESYTPIIKERPAFGWGVTSFPAMNGQASIDNQYLLLAVTQGFTGLGLFLAIIAGTLVRLFRLAGRPMKQEDRMLVFAHLAILIGLATTLTTVFLGEQALILFFLMVGWVQGMNPARVEGANRRLQPFRFRRVLG
jgi:O-antigen ligase